LYNLISIFLDSWDNKRLRTELYSLMLFAGLLTMLIGKMHLV